MANHRLKSRATRLETVWLSICRVPYWRLAAGRAAALTPCRPGQRGWPSISRRVSEASVINVNREALVSQPQISQVLLQMRDVRKRLHKYISRCPKMRPEGDTVQCLLWLESQNGVIWNHIYKSQYKTYANRRWMLSPGNCNSGHSRGALGKTKNKSLVLLSNIYLERSFVSVFVANYFLEKTSFVIIAGVWWVFP